MTTAQNRGYVKWGKRQSQAMRNGFLGYSLKGNSYPFSFRVVAAFGRTRSLSLGVSVSLYRGLSDLN